MTKMKEFQGVCKCKRFLKFRITDVKENEDEESSDVIAWLIFGVCEKCNVIWMQGIFKGARKPELDIDFLIDYSKMVKGSDINV